MSQKKPLLAFPVSTIRTVLNKAELDSFKICITKGINRSMFSYNFALRREDLNNFESSIFCEWTEWDFSTIDCFRKEDGLSSDSFLNEQEFNDCWYYITTEEKVDENGKVIDTIEIKFENFHYGYVYPFAFTLAPSSSASQNHQSKPFRIKLTFGNYIGIETAAYVFGHLSYKSKRRFFIHSKHLSTHNWCIPDYDVFLRNLIRLRLVYYTEGRHSVKLN